MAANTIVAILGVTSQLAADYYAEAARSGNYNLRAFARDPAAGRRALEVRGISAEVFDLATFEDGDYSAIVNFIGVGDPARAAAMGSTIFEITRHWDERVLGYLRRFPDTRYVFFSSGAVYGDAFDAPVGPATLATFPINRLGPTNWYALAKLGAEAGHRALPEQTIIDLRIFNYVSRTQDIGARFLVTDAARAIRDSSLLETTAQAVTRDYLDPPGLHRLVGACLAAPIGTNCPVDAYSRAPITKAELLALLGQAFGLRYEERQAADTINATGIKPCYYSLDRTAAAWGYEPPHSSAEAVTNEVAGLLAHKAG